MPKPPPDERDSDWIKYENLEMTSASWWALLFLALLVVMACSGLMLLLLG